VAITFGPTSTVPSAMLVELARGTPSGFSYAASRAYTITATGGGPFSATLRLRYQDSELGNGEANLRLWRHDGSSWTQQGATAADATANWVEASGVTAFSPWGLSNQTPTAITLQAMRAEVTDRASLLPIGLGAILLILAGGALVINRKQRRSQA